MQNLKQTTIAHQAKTDIKPISTQREIKNSSSGGEYKKLLYFSCECNIEKNNFKHLEVTNSTTSRIKILNLFYKKLGDYETLCTKIWNEKTREEYFSFTLEETKQVHTKLMEEGKMTINVVKVKKGYADDNYIVFIKDASAASIKAYVNILSEDVAKKKKIPLSDNKNMIKEEPSKIVEKIQAKARLVEESLSRKGRGNIYDRQKQIKDGTKSNKRKFSEIENLKTSTNQIKRSKTTEIDTKLPQLTLNKNIKSLNNLPRDLLRIVLTFMERKDITNIYLNKKNRALFDLMRISLYFTQTLVSPAHIKNIVNRSVNLRQLVFKNNLSKALIQSAKYIKLPLLKNLKVLDIMDLYLLNNEALTSIMTKLSGTIETLKISVLSDITGVCIDNIRMSFKKLRNFELSTRKYHEKVQPNVNIIASLLTLLGSAKKFEKLRLFYVTPSMIKNIESCQKDLVRLEIEQIIPEPGLKEINEEVLALTLPKLQKLNLVKGIIELTSSSAAKIINLLFQNILTGANEITSVSLGPFVTSESLALLNEKAAPRIKKLKLFSQNINDNDVGQLIKNASSLEYLNIRNCRGISGEMFEWCSIPPLLKLMECSFDEYTTKIVRSIIKSNISVCEFRCY